MATVDSTGITPTTLDEYVEFLNTVFQTAFGSDFNVDPDTPQGQVIGNMALSMSQSDDAHVLTAQAMDILSASDSQLDGLASLLSIQRDAETNTLVTAQLTGVAATLIPEGSLAKTDAGDQFASTEDLTLDGAGEGSVTFQAVEGGAVACGVNELTNIVSVVSGWETIDNSGAGTVGEAEETDSEYRARYFEVLAKNAVTPLDSVIAAVADLDTVTEVRGVENDTSAPVTVDGVSVDAHSICIVVAGGADADIAAAIRLKKTGGTGTVGDEEVDDSPPSEPIHFYRGTDVDIEVDVDITILDSDVFPSNGLELIKTRIYEYITGDFEGSSDSENYFEVDGMTFGEDLYKQRLYTPINSVPGHVVNTLTMDLLGDGGDQSSISVDLNEKITFASIDDITITSS